MFETNTLNQTVDNRKILQDENATVPTDSRTQQETIVCEVYKHLYVASQLRDKQKRSEEIVTVLKGVDWEYFGTSSSPSEWKPYKEFKSLSMIQTPSSKLVLLDWQQPVAPHIHQDRRGGFCDAYVLCVRGTVSHDRYLVKEFSEFEVVVSLPENELLLPGDVAIVYGGTEAHAMGPLEKGSALWTVHYYTGSIVPSNPNQRLKIKRN
ncbi:hypothetical protein NDI37_08785 [Funiculus sociatus GB2-A5]|uniref:Cysteine dioxygenase n=1 Tax=Funiculus sociatus GB2-A5 TaxID=2933946 RepID=A0ABV0JPG0_9CYAN|nr:MULTISPECIES: hypothetical protein [unclassified Trichocoleus]MBD1904929.1 hypothetical protein [Trichocoleus sp. FACHB-832]MBD2064689.1 hypothetical protein [Trichocoleus sp. FACHB-6]